MRRSLDQRVKHVITVARPGEEPIGHLAAVLLIGHHVSHDLAWMGIVGQAVDDRHRGIFGHFKEAIMRRGADHDDVDIARENARGVGDRFGAAELHLRAGQHQRLAAKLPHGNVEGDTGSRRWLVEDHRKHLTLEGPVDMAGLQLLLARARVTENGAQLVRGDGGQIGEMAYAVVQAHLASPGA